MTKKLIILLSLVTCSFPNDNFYLALSANTTAMDYTETSNGSKLDTEKSNLFGRINGFNIDFGAKVANNFLLADTTKIIINYEYIKGNSNYTGSPLGSGKPYGSITNYTSNTIQRGQILLSQINNTSYGNAIFNIGVGQRVWNRNLSTIQTEDYSWYYGIIGAGFEFNVLQNLTLGLNGYYQKALNPKMQYNSTAQNTTYTLGSTYGYRVEIPLKYNITSSISAIGSFALDNWTINKSNIINGNYEPPSTTNNKSASLGFAFKF